MENKFAKPISFFLFIVVLLAIVFYYFYQKKEQIQPATNFTEARATAKDLIYKKGDNRAAISALEMLLGTASTEDQEALLKTDLAFTYLRLRDFKKGTDLFKEIAENKEYSPARRAYAVKAMADWFMLGSRAIGDGFANTIFSGDKYSGFVVATTTSKNAKVLIGIRRLYDYSASISANAVSKYRLAEWFAKFAANSKLDKNVASKDSAANYIELIKKNISDGDELFLVGSAEGAFKTELGYAKWVKAETLGILGELTGDKKFFNESDRVFKDALLLLASTNEPDVFYTKSNILWADFYYAAFLSRAYGKSRESDIKTLIGDIVSSSKDGKESGLGLFRYLKRLGTLTRPGGMQAYDISGALLLAKNDKDFELLLKNLGWKNL